MSDLDTLRTLVQAHAARRAAINTYTVGVAARGVRRFDRWYDTAAITALSVRMASQVQASQRQTASLTDAFLARVLTLLTGRLVKPSGAVKVTALRTGVEHPAVYGRLADQFRYERSLGTAEPDVLRHVLTRAEVLAETDLDLAFRAQVQRMLQGQSRVAGYRRVLHPEVSNGGSCGLCIAASDRVYHRAELMPIHARCACGVLPIVGDRDPGQTLNADDLAALYKAAGSTSGADLKRVRIAVHHHGELGPQLRAAEDHFRGPASL